MEANNHVHNSRGDAPRRKRPRRGAGSAFRCAHRRNDIIVQGLNDYLDDVKAKVKLPHVLQRKTLAIQRAIKSVQKYPLPLRRTYDIQLLKYVGDKTAGIIFRILKDRGEEVDTGYGQRMVQAEATSSAQHGSTSSASSATSATGRSSSSHCSPSYSPRFGQPRWAYLCAMARLAEAASDPEQPFQRSEVVAAATQLLTMVSSAGAVARESTVKWSTIASDLQKKGLLNRISSTCIGLSVLGQEVCDRLIEDRLTIEALARFEMSAVMGTAHYCVSGPSNSTTASASTCVDTSSSSSSSSTRSTTGYTESSVSSSSSAGSTQSIAPGLDDFSPTRDFVPNSSQFDSPTPVMRCAYASTGAAKSGGGGSVVLSKNSRGSSVAVPNESTENCNDSYFQKLQQSPDIKTRIVLLVDSRENHQADRQFFLSRLLQNRIDCEQRALAIGDMMWVLQVQSKRCDSVKQFVLDFIVERKIITDLTQSISDGRFIEQKGRLRRSGIRRKIYLVEGPLVRTSQITVATMKAALAKIQLHGFLVKRTQNSEASVEFLTQMHREIVSLYRSRPGKVLTNPRMLYHEVQQKSAKDAVLTVRDLFKRQLTQLPGVGIDRARMLASHFQTSRALYDYCKPRPAIETPRGQSQAEFAERVRKKKLSELSKLKSAVTESTVGLKAARTVYANFT